MVHNVRRCLDPKKPHKQTTGIRVVQKILAFVAIYGEVEEPLAVVLMYDRACRARRVPPVALKAATEDK
jgi:hypothetical protein